MGLPVQQAFTQDVVLQDTTLNTNETFTSSNAIVAGPNVSIGSSGEVIFAAKKVAVIPQFFIVQGGKWYVVTGRLPTGIETDETQAIPSDFVVYQNYPNPFNPSTKISYGLLTAEYVEITIYDLSGNRVRTLISAHQQAGQHAVVWDGTNENGERASSGLFYYKITAGNFSVTKRMILLK
jgi:hypothetical protein